MTGSLQAPPSFSRAFRMAQTKIREMPQSERPREKLLGRGAAALTDSELVAILLRTGLPGANAVEVARQLLERYGSLSGLSRCTVKEIASIRGIGAARASSVWRRSVSDNASRMSGCRARNSTPRTGHDLVAAEMRTLHKNRLASSCSKRTLLLMEEVSSAASMKARAYS